MYTAKREYARGRCKLVSEWIVLDSVRGTGIQDGGTLYLAGVI